MIRLFSAMGKFSRNYGSITSKIFLISVLLLALLYLNPTPVFSQIEWIRNPNPVFGPGNSGSWDDQNVGLACVIKVGDTFHLWYDANWDNGGNANAGIGHATSLNGMDWNRDSLNPVLVSTPTLGITQVAVIFNPTDSLFHMWYVGFRNSDSAAIDHATSIDGGHWILDTLNNPVLAPGNPGSWDDRWCNGVSVIRVNTTYHMFYDGRRFGESVMRIGHAASTDGINWTKNPNNPILVPENNTDWDYPQIRITKAFFDGIRYHLFYDGGYWSTYDIGYAFSDDLNTWTKYNDPTTTTLAFLHSDPVLKKGTFGSWDDYGVIPGSVMFNSSEDSLIMWYCGTSNGASTAQIGYATSLIHPVGLEDYDKVQISENFSLSQNYPNPFNPSTTIQFDLPKTGEVSLKVFNILGEEVVTLVTDRLSAGSYSYELDASHFASGVYLYRLHAGDPSSSAGHSYVETKKMVLMK